MGVGVTGYRSSSTSCIGRSRIVIGSSVVDNTFSSTFGCLCLCHGWCECVVFCLSLHLTDIVKLAYKMYITYFICLSSLFPSLKLLKLALKDLFPFSLFTSSPSSHNQQDNTLSINLYLNRQPQHNTIPPWKNTYFDFFFKHLPKSPFL